MKAMLRVVWCLTFAATFAAQVSAADRFWIRPAGDPGDFNDPANWDGGTLPANNDHPSIQNGGTGQISTDVPYVPDEIWVGNNGGAGTLEQGAGNVNYNYWFVVGRNGGGSGAVGTFTMTGGTVKKVAGGGSFIVGDAGTNTGYMTMSNNATATANGGETWIGTGGGTGQLTMNDSSVFNADLFVIGRDGGNGAMTMNGSSVRAGGEVWIGQNWGSVGYLQVNDNARIDNDGWFVVGRYHAAGVLDMNGGVINKTGGGNVIIGSLAGNGTFNMNGGQLNNNAMIVLSEWADGVREPGVFNLKGGVAQATAVQSWAGLGTFNFNGGTLQAMGDHGDYMTADNLMVQTGGAVIDSNGHNITISRALLEDAASTGGGLIKKGGGTLALGGANSYTGATVVQSGTLLIGGAPTMVGGIQVNAGATLGGDAVISAVTLDDGAYLAPGFTNTDPNRTGVLRPANLASAAGGTIRFKLTDNPYAGNDQVQIAGDMNLVGTTIDVSRMLNAALGSGTYTLVTSGTTTAVSGLTLYTGLPGGTRQTFNLDTSTPNTINLIVGGDLPANLAWRGDGAGNLWDVGTSTTWDNAGTPDKFYNLDSVLFDDAGIANNTVKIPADVLPQSVNVNVSAGNAYTFAGAGRIIGGTGVTKSGEGTLTLTNPNTYLGPTTINAGELVVSGVGTLSDQTHITVGTTSGVPARFTLDNTSPMTLQPPAIAGAPSSQGVWALSNSQVTLNGELAVARGDNSQATLSLSGASQLKVNGQFNMSFLAANATSLLTLADTSSMTVTDLFRVTSGGAVTLSGSSAITAQGGWTAFGTVDGPTQGTATLKMSDQAVFTSQNVLIFGDNYDSGAGRYGNGEANITGGTLNANGGLMIGRWGDGTVGAQGKVTLSGTSETPAVINTGYLAVGQGDGDLTPISSGTLIVSGNSTINDTGDLNVGYRAHATGTLTATGGTIQARNLFVGRWDSSTGTATLSGTTRMVATNESYVGAYGSSIGHMVLTDSASFVQNNDWFFVGRQDTAKGTLELSGGDGTTPGASIDVQNGDINIGTYNNAVGQMTMTDYSKAHSRYWLWIGREGDSQGTLTMSGHSSYVGDDQMHVGVQGTGTIDASGDATLAFAGTAVVGDWGVNDPANSNVHMGAGHMILGGNAKFSTGGEFWVGNGDPTTLDNSLVMNDNAQIASNYWFVVGRDQGTGSMTMNGNSYAHSAILGGATIVGDYASHGSKLTMNDTARFDVAGELWVGQGTGAGTLEMNGDAQLTTQNWLAVGRDNGTGTLTMNGGTVTKSGGGNIIVGSLGGKGTWNQNAGVVYNNAGLVLGENSNTGALNLKGGTFQAQWVDTWGGATGYLNFNGGTLQATASNATYVGGGAISLMVQAGGAVIDSNGNNIGINRVLAEDITSSGGGLRKIGAGTLTLGAVNTYSGSTTINAGVLQVGIDGAIPFGAGKGSVVLNGVGGPVAAGALDMNGHNVRINGLSGTMGASLGQVYSSVAAPVTLTVGDADAGGNFAGEIMDGSGPVALAKIGAGTQVLSGNNTYSGGTSVTGGTLVIDSATALPTGRGLTIGAPGGAAAAAASAAAVPEPSTLALLVVAAAGLLVAACRRR